MTGQEAVHIVTTALYSIFLRHVCPRLTFANHIGIATQSLSLLQEISGLVYLVLLP
jgi:hypothetical protein